MHNLIGFVKAPVLTLHHILSRVHVDAHHLWILICEGEQPWVLSLLLSHLSIGGVPILGNVSQPYEEAVAGESLKDDMN